MHRLGRWWPTACTRTGLSPFLFGTTSEATQTSHREPIPPSSSLSFGCIVSIRLVAALEKVVASSGERRFREERSVGHCKLHCCWYSAANVRTASGTVTTLSPWLKYLAKGNRAGELNGNLTPILWDCSFLSHQRIEYPGELGTRWQPRKRDNPGCARRLLSHSLLAERCSRPTRRIPLSPATDGWLSEQTCRLLHCWRNDTRRRGVLRFERVHRQSKHAVRLDNNRRRIPLTWHHTMLLLLVLLDAQRR